MLLLFFPEGEVLLEELDDGLGISEGLLIDVINLLKSIRQGLLTEFAGLLVVVHHFVVEHGEVQSQTKSDWVAGVQRLRSGLSKLVVVESAIFDGIELTSLGALGDVSVVISDHLVEEGLGLIGGGNLHALVLDDVDNGDALVIEFTLDLLLVSGETVVKLLVLWILLDGADRSNSGSLRANLVLETNGKQVSLLGGEVLILVLNDLLEVVDHIVKSFGLFSDSSHKYILFQ